MNPMSRNEARLLMDKSYENLCRCGEIILMGNSSREDYRVFLGSMYNSLRALNSVMEELVNNQMMFPDEPAPSQSDSHQGIEHH